MEIFVQWLSYGIYAYFPDPTRVANSGDTVELSLLANSFPDAKNLRWRHDGVAVEAWNDQQKVKIVDVKPANAGIYECYNEGKRHCPHALVRLIVRKCGKDLFGEICDRKCPVCYNGGICEDRFGICICAPGFTGNYCEFACGKNLYGAECSKECTPPSCKHQLFCKSDPYRCSCASGYSGSICSDGCAKGRYGVGCKQHCHSANGPGYCNIYTGACSGGCSVGWTGQSCQMEGFFDTTFTVLISSSHNIICYSDDNYKKIKFMNLVGSGSARDLPLNSNTSNQAAVLDFRAHPGVYACRFRVHNWSEGIVFPYQGSNECREGPYGDACDQKCPPCYNGGVCHQVQGICICPPGFEGNNCEVVCREKHFSIDYLNVCPGHNSSGNLFCKPDPYGCSCAPGFKEFDCKESCEPGWYGAHCKQPCHCARGPASCNRYTGACSGGCSHGWRGQSCQIVACKPGWFGEDCKHPCHCAGGPESCDPHSGACSGDCSPGWRGRSCQIVDYFDTNFILMALRFWNVTCYSDENYKNIEFSWVQGTRGGEGRLPPGATTSVGQNSAFLNISAVGFYDTAGVYKCEMKVINTSMEISVPMQYGHLHFTEKSKVAHIGDTVQLEVYMLFEERTSPFEWRHNGVLLPEWEGQTKVEIRNVQLADAGIYECSYRDVTLRMYHALTKLIVRKCGRDVFGENCDLKCPTCYNGGICHDVFGICLCPPGFSGNNCEVACGKERFGPDCTKVCRGTECYQILFCLPDPYGCSCISGLHGSTCYREYKPGWYGADCKQPCHCAKGPQYCDRHTGACLGGCSPEWTGQSCQIEGLSRNAKQC